MQPAGSYTRMHAACIWATVELAKLAMHIVRQPSDFEGVTDECRHDQCPAASQHSLQQRVHPKHTQGAASRDEHVAG
jgi:hypothetical protein